MKIILASGSPRRRELMQQMGLTFEVDTDTSFVETVPDGADPFEVPSIFAKGKSEGFHRPLQKDEVLVSADTIVICDGRILGKPHTPEVAGQMLRDLSGKTHHVVSAVCVRTADRCLLESDTATVHFKALSDGEIEHYLKVYSPLDKAGAYGIQEWIGLVGITRIEGSFYTIMGLPTHLLYSLLERIK